MRVKQILSFPPLAKLQLLWERLYFNKLTLFYFIFSVVHCIVQIVLQAQAFTVNAQAESFLRNLITQGNATGPGFPVFGNDLRWCNTVPNNTNAMSCQVIWNGQPYSSSSSSSPSSLSTSATSTASLNVEAAFTSSSSVPSSVSASPSSSSVTLTESSAVARSSAASSSALSRQIASGSSVSSPPTITLVSSRGTVVESVQGATTTVDGEIKPTATVQVTEGDNDGEGDHAPHKRSLYGIIQAIQVNGTVSVDVHGLGNTEHTVQLDKTCLVSLNWPALELADTKREDITFIAFQIWVLGMSIVALLNESIPHIIASLLTHALATSWAAFTIRNTTVFHDQFNRLMKDGPCQQPSLLPTYWNARGDAEIAGLALNAVALLASAFLSWRLIRLFGWQTFKRVGASFIINRVYKFVLSLSIVIQLSLFFIVASLGLWLDQLWNGQIGMLTTHALRFKVVVLVVFVLLLPWLGMGWFAVRRELKVPMAAFITLSMLYIVGWAVMFVSHTFRWTFTQWRFFGVVTSASVFLTLMTFILGVICRMNFGKGLPRYLNAQEPLPGDNFGSDEKTDEEKVAFPGQNVPIPTFSAAFGSGNEVPPPSQMFAPRQMGPRFYAHANAPFNSASSMSSTQVPSPVHARQVSNASSTWYTGGAALSRNDSRGSERSYTSQSSGHSSDRTTGGKRWLIE
ncbi:hypothetical protein NEOLEDRAFT_1150266 [Neolentinus lepideus HHB14362 ss-1]|uniref:PalH-domain-containing protein n=1 Tax=Neolentinus lepideus HHB14362 ss-1 TaxID=1314782 RepID=A0A165QAH3_9AGAM|nr:hypothetical protein NEOLEDRAFT_1150266 [Neolentinus lepideus HHB14362 ss-1]